MTRLERWVASHPYDKPEWIRLQLSKRGVECTLDAVEAAIQSASCRRSLEGYHTTIEGGDDGERPRIIASRLTKKIRLALIGKDAPLSGFGGGSPLKYRKDKSCY